MAKHRQQYPLSNNKKQQFFLFWEYSEFK